MGFWATYPPSAAAGSGGSVTQGTVPWIVAGQGTAGTPATGVVTVQGITGGTPIPVSGTVAVTGPLSVTQGTSPWVVSGTVTANIGTTGGLALDSTLAKLTIAPGTAIGSNTGALILGSVTTAAPTYTTGQLSPLSLSTTGALRVDSSGSTGTVTVTNAFQLDTTGAKLNVAQGGALGTNTGPLVQGSASTAAPTYTTGTVNPLSLTLGGGLRVDLSGTTVPLPTGAATSALQTTGNTSLASIDTKTPTLGQKTSTGSVPVVLASDQNAVPTSVGGKAASLQYSNSYTGAAQGNITNVLNPTTGGFTQIVASTATAITKLYVFDSSGSAMMLATGAAASEVPVLFIPPGGSTAGFEIAIPAGTRLSLKAIDVNPTAGYILLTGLN